MIPIIESVAGMKSYIFLDPSRKPCHSYATGIISSKGTNLSTFIALAFLFCDLASQLEKEMFTETCWVLFTGRAGSLYIPKRDASPVGEIGGGVKITQMHLKDSTLLTSRRIISS